MIGPTRREDAFAINRRLALALSAAAAGSAFCQDVAAADADSDVEILTTGLATKTGRLAPTRILAPLRSRAPCGVLAFSHGANSTNLAYDRCLIPWARRGYVVIAPNHLDAGGAPPRSVLSHEDLWTSRVQDLEAALDQRAAIDALVGREGRSVDWSQVAAVGHSFGGMVAQALAGATGTPPVLTGADPRVRAVLALSPPGPLAGFIAADAWTGIKVPMLVQTGTADVLKGFIDDWRLHLRSAEVATSSERWTAVGDGVDHMFGGLICELRDGSGAQLPALEAVVDIGGLFLDAFAKADGAARRRLALALATQAFAPFVTLAKLP
jgi:predicted dienelactone hydrolase